MSSLNKFKWGWKMDYCESMNLTPAIESDWKEAELEYHKLFKNENNE